VIETKTKIAKNLRNQMTEAEKFLWYMLKAKNFYGFKFRRQAPIGKYIVDFVCYDRKLIVEIDGGQHASLVKEQDEVRDQWLEKEGFTVLRFWNNEVLGNRNGVLERISAYLLPSPNPSHKREGNI